MRRVMISILFLIWLCLPFALAEEVDSNRLIDEAQAYDGREIVFSGEVIGDILDSGGHVWLNVSDGDNAIGVWTSRDLAREVEMVGRYAQHGDTVRVTGVFHRACPEHGGDFDIHAQRIALIERGYPVMHPVQRWKVILAVALSILAFVCMTFAFSKIDHRRTPRPEASIKADRS